MLSRKGSSVAQLGKNSCLSGSSFFVFRSRCEGATKTGEGGESFGVGPVSVEYGRTGGVSSPTRCMGLVNTVVGSDKAGPAWQLKG